MKIERKYGGGRSQAISVRQRRHTCPNKRSFHPVVSAAVQSDATGREDGRSARLCCLQDGHQGCHVAAL